jgi:hypothetical protein
MQIFPFTTHWAVGAVASQRNDQAQTTLARSLDDVVNGAKGFRIEADIAIFPDSSPKIRWRATCPSAKCVTKVRGFAEPHKLRNRFRAEFRGAEIFFCQTATDIVENLSKRGALRMEFAVQRTHSGGKLLGRHFHG